MINTHGVYDFPHPITGQTVEVEIADDDTLSFGHSVLYPDSEWCSLYDTEELTQ